MKNLKKNYAYQYALIAWLFGLLFPLMGSLVLFWNTDENINVSLLKQEHIRNPLFWLLDSLPFIFGIMAYYFGKENILLKTKQDQTLLELREQLVIQGHLAAIGKLTAEIVHEIKNPLSFIGNFSEGSIELIEDLLKYLSDNFQEKEGMQFVHFEEQLLELKLNAIDICTNTQRANEIVYKIMDQTNLQNQFQIVNVNDIIVENWNFSWSNFKHQYPQLDIEININLLPDLQPILANKNSLGRVLLNIFDNAFDALIQKKSECLDLFTPKILITCFLKEDKMHMLIEDNGLGIPITKLDEIFQPFYTTKPIGEGNAGLGLSISKEIIENEHLGKLLVESELGQYARFIIILPI